MKSPGRRWPWQTPQAALSLEQQARKDDFRNFIAWCLLSIYRNKIILDTQTNTKWLPKYVWQDVIAGNHKNNQLKNGDGPGKHRLNQTTKLTSLMWGQNEIMWREAHHLYGTMAQSVLTWISSCGEKIELKLSDSPQNYLAWPLHKGGCCERQKSTELHETETNETKSE